MKTYGCVGYPLAHSFSKHYFEEKFKKKGIPNARFVNYEVEDIHNLPGIIESDSTLCGFSVTIPHKMAVIPFLEDIDETANAVGAVNSVKVSNDGTLTGYNTDVHGFTEAISPFLKDHHTAALILGTGGAARAVQYALQQLRLPHLFASMYPENDDQVAYEALDEATATSHPVIVNCTPLGMFPDVGSFPPIPYEHLTKEHLLFDLTYNPPETAFMKKGAERGATVVNGQKMLEHQADLSWDIWNR